jgi:hypothetical protein
MIGDTRSDIALPDVYHSAWIALVPNQVDAVRSHTAQVNVVEWAPIAVIALDPT